MEFLRNLALKGDHLARDAKDLIVTKVLEFFRLGRKM